MEFRTYFRHMDTSLPLYAYAQKKLGEQVDKYHFKVTDARVTFDVEKGVDRVSCHLLGAEGLEVAVEAQNQVSMYAAVDDLADKLVTQLRRAKEKRRSHRMRAVDDIPAPTVAVDEASIDATEVIAIERARRQAGR